MRPSCPLTTLITLSLLPSALSCQILSNRDTPIIVTRPDGTTYNHWTWDEAVPYDKIQTSYTHWRQFPQYHDRTDCPQEDWWPHISEDAQYRWLRSRYLDRDYLGIDGDGDSNGDRDYDYYLGGLRSRRWDLFDVIPRVIGKEGLDVVRRLIREQAELAGGGGGGAAAADDDGVVSEDTPLPPRLWSCMGGEDQKFWYDMLSYAASGNNMEAIGFYVEELGVPPYLFRFPKLPRGETRESWAAMDEEAREEEAQDYAYFTIYKSPLEKTFVRGSVEAAEYLLNTGLAGEGELPWEGLEEMGKVWPISGIEGQKERVDTILQLLREQCLTRPGTFDVGMKAEVWSQSRCWLNGCPSLVTVLFGGKF
ncbi:hypothetical protein QBC32DRAFT_325529 [Pseudoneurospora amorphoporcata]|uniref:Uncharacterized protein n=1 Tax=Pseudoneurospora amorphoporcata TaxID=241081 RepID=A0AAN6NSP6_9PEZI|nr:hypothetical protein QBC32DRAFT_325529 [Pseudoneurospora amorphoporcata]